MILLFLIASPSFELSADALHRLNARGGLRDLTISLSGNRFDYSQYLAAGPSDAYQSLFAQAQADAYLLEWFTVRAMLNTGELRERDGEVRLNGRSASDELRTTGLVRTALLDFHASQTQWWQLQVGRKLWRVGNSLVYDDYGLGASLSFDFDLLNGSPWRAELAYLIPSREWVDLPLASPLLTARVDYVLSLFDSVSLSVSYFHDGTNELAEPLRETVIEGVLTRPRLGELLKQQALALYLFNDFQTRADFAYTTAGLSKTIGPGRLKVTGVFQAGHIDAVIEQRRSREAVVSRSSFAGAFDVSYRWSVTGRFSLSPWVFGQTGTAPADLQGSGNYSGYLGVLPFITKTNLFFAGGLNETFGARRLVPSGVNGRGVIAGGVEAYYEPVDALALRAVVAPLGAWADPLARPLGGGGRFYGLELDANVLYNPTRNLTLSAEGDVLFGGNFYREPTPAWKFIFSFAVAGDSSL